MNYHRIQWDKKHKKRNPIAQELETPKYRQRRREPKDKTKLNPRTIERLLDDQD